MTPTRTLLDLRCLAFLAAAGLAGCGEDPTAATVEDASPPVEKPATRLPPLDAAPRKAGPPPEVDDLHPVDISDPDIRPSPGNWDMTSHVLTSNTCAYDPRQSPEGPCTMGCAPTVISSAGPGLFTLDAPSIRYLGTCAIIDEGRSFTCRGGVAMVPGKMVLTGDFEEGYTVTGRWTLDLVEGSLDPGCTFTGEFKAQESPAG